MWQLYINIIKSVLMNYLNEIDVYKTNDSQTISWNTQIFNGANLKKLKTF